MARTTEQIRQALADGRACRRVHVFEEAWYWPSQSRTLAPGVVKSWSVGVDALTESGRPDGCIGEFTIDWYQFGSDRAPSMQVCAFSEVFAAMRACDGLVEWLFGLAEDVTPGEVRAGLEALGFKDVTARAEPGAGASI